jgi:lauroyl/myristoyl acyltransferase
VFGAFFDFVADMGRFRGVDAERLRGRISRVDGEPEYLRARGARRGAVLVTAHLGSFEVGMAALRAVEPAVTVVFKRDASAAFEAIRSELRGKLGIKEAAVDDGWATLIKLKEALQADEVVALQGDRAMPGQRSASVPFFSGHLRVPAGPVTLARLVGSPIVPVFTAREADGKYSVELAKPIWVGDDEPDEVALRQLAAAIEARVARCPEQWLVLHRAFEEDREGGENVG